MTARANKRVEVTLCGPNDESTLHLRTVPGIVQLRHRIVTGMMLEAVAADFTALLQYGSFLL